MYPPDLKPKTLLFRVLRPEEDADSPASTSSRPWPSAPVHSNLVVAQELALLAVLVVGLKQLRPDFLVQLSSTVINMINLLGKTDDLVKNDN